MLLDWGGTMNKDLAKAIALVGAAGLLLLAPEALELLAGLAALL